jgi:hypothetical protein
VLVLAACQVAPPTVAVIPQTVEVGTVTPPRPTPTPIPITIYPQDFRQTIRHVGSGNFIHRYGGVSTALDPVSGLNMEILQPRFARVHMALDTWEPENDNGDPGDIEAAAFRDSGDNHATFELLRIFKERKVEVIASIWGVPDWLVEDPEPDTQRIIPRALYSEAIESIAAWLLRARDEYGLEVAYVSFNEANLGINVLLSPADVIAMVSQAGPRFAELGLKTRWLLGDCASVNGCLDYLRPIWAEQSIRPYLGPLAFHSWDALNVSDGALEAIGAFALQEGLEVLCTEAGWDPQLWQRAAEFPDWNNARRLGIVYSRVLKLTRASAVYYWEMMGQDYSLNDGSKPYPALDMVRLFNGRLPPGSQILGTSPNGSNRYLLAAQTPSGLVLFLTNAATKEDVRVTGLPDGEYELVLYNEKAFGQVIEPLSVKDGSAGFELAGFSLTVLAQK